MANPPCVQVSAEDRRLGPRADSSLAEQQPGSSAMPGPSQPSPILAQLQAANGSQLTDLTPLTAALAHMQTPGAQNPSLASSAGGASQQHSLGAVGTAVKAALAGVPCCL